MHLSAERKVKVTDFLDIKTSLEPVMVQRETWKLGVPSAQSKSFSLKSEMSFIQLFEYLHFHSLANFKPLFQEMVHSVHFLNVFYFEKFMQNPERSIGIGNAY